MFKILLCIPPDYDYKAPPLGTPALCAFLKQRGIYTRQTDLNLKYRDFLTKHISGSLANTAEKRFFLKILLKKFFEEKLKNRYYSGILPKENDDIFSPLPYGNNTNSSFSFTERLLSSDFLWEYLEDKDENTFYQFYEDIKILDFLDKEDINITGISIISPTQVIASLTLGLLIKKNLPHIHVVIGGQWPTLYRNELLKKGELFRCFDSFVIFEGETPLYNLVMSLKQGKDISAIPQVILEKSNKSKNKSYIHEEDLNLLPCPDFDGLPLDEYDGYDDYDNKDVVLTYETSRGCYWSKCAYCVDLPLPKPSYRRKHPDLVVNDIKQLKQKYNFNRLLISDPGVSPRQIVEISQRMVDDGLEIKWWCMARLDPGFNEKIFKIAARSGLWQINFGFESANDRICKLLDKGNKKENSLRVIKECSAAGIDVDLQTMLGLPRETLMDALETVEFLVTNKEFITEVTFNTYYLTPSNFIHQNPEKYGIEYDKKSPLPFIFHIPFNNKYGMTAREAELLQKTYWSLLRRKNAADKKQALPFNETLFLRKDLSEGRLEFYLNGESVNVNYLSNPANGECIFIEEQERQILNLIEKGLRPNDIYSSLCQRYPEEQFKEKLLTFIELAYKKGFLTKQITHIYNGAEKEA